MLALILIMYAFMIATLQVMISEIDFVIWYCIFLLIMGRWFRFAENQVQIDMDEFTSGLLKSTE